MRTPVILVAGQRNTDPVVGALLRTPRTLVVEHRFDGQVVRRTTVALSDGVLTSNESGLELAHGCVSCTIRNDLLVLLRQLHRRDDVDRIVVGLPLHTGGGESESSAKARQWGTWLAEATGLVVVFFDERYTSVEAEDVLRSAGIKLRNRKDKRDMLAARLLLQAYLDAGSPEGERPATSLIDEDDAERAP